MNGKDVETVSLAKLTRFYLLKQFLLRKAKQNKVEDTIGAMCGLHAQLALTPYLSLWNRIKDFKPEMLDAALYKEKSLVKTWLMRGTLHIIPSKDLPIYHNALKNMWFEHHGRFMKKPEWPSLEERRKLFHPKIFEALAERPLRRKELNNKVRSLLGNESKRYERIFSAWGGILKETSYLGLTVYAEQCGKEACFARLDKWLPQINLSAIEEKQAGDKLLIKYLQGYGPASVQDFAYWSGLLASEARRAIENMKAKLRELQVQDRGKILWLLKDDLTALEKIDLEEQAFLVLLPKFDPYLLGHKDKTRIIREEFQKRVYRPAGDVTASILVNGRIAGTWNHKKTKKTLTVSITPFEKFGKKSLTELRRAADELGNFMGVEQTKCLLNK